MGAGHLLVPITVLGNGRENGVGAGRSPKVKEEYSIYLGDVS